MKKVFLLIIISILSGHIFSQKTPKWELGIITGYQFQLNKKNEEFFNIIGNSDQGVHQIGLFLKREIINNRKFIFQLGIGNSIERVASIIEVNHCYGFTNCLGIFITKKGYTVSLLETSFDLKYRIQPKLKFSLGIIPQFRFYQNTTTNESYSKFTFKLHAIESYTGFEYNLNKVNISLRYRWLNLRSIDPVFSLGNDFISSSQEYYDKSIDFYNPAKLRFLVAFDIF